MPDKYVWGLALMALCNIAGYANRSSADLPLECKIGGKSFPPGKSVDLSGNFADVFPNLEIFKRFNGFHAQSNVEICEIANFCWNLKPAT
jgi:hypothetical protein